MHVNSCPRVNKWVVYFWSGFQGQSTNFDVLASIHRSSWPGDGPSVLLFHFVSLERSYVFSLVYCSTYSKSFRCELLICRPHPVHQFRKYSNSVNGNLKGTDSRLIDFQVPSTNMQLRAFFQMKVWINFGTCPFFRYLVKNDVTPFYKLEYGTPYSRCMLLVCFLIVSVVPVMLVAVYAMFHYKDFAVGFKWNFRRLFYSNIRWLGPFSILGSCSLLHTFGSLRYSILFTNSCLTKLRFVVSLLFTRTQNNLWSLWCILLIDMLLL